MLITVHFCKPLDDVELSETLIKKRNKTSDFNKHYNLPVYLLHYLEMLLQNVIMYPYPTIKIGVPIKGDYRNGKNSID